MVSAGARKFGWLAGILFCACSLLAAQQPVPSQLDDSGQVVVAGRATPYLIRHLPLNAFPQLPAALVELLTRRGCLIPQTYEAHQPENVIHASLERAGSSDWAVLCSSNGSVALLVFFSSAPAGLFEVVSAPETGRLQRHDASGVLGFNWGIDPATPEQLRQAQAGMEHRPPPVDHDALADSVIDRRTVYRFYSNRKWALLDAPQ